MAQTKEGAIKIAAKKTGVSVDEYRSNIQRGFLWCTGCKAWHKINKFNFDKSRWSGRAQSCRKYLRVEYKRCFKPIPPKKRKRMGPLPDQERSGDKKQARHRVNVLVRTGKIPPPNNLECSDCGHIHKPGGLRHEYDHYNGYRIGNHTVVIPVCSKCHHRRHPMDYRKRKGDPTKNLKHYHGEKHPNSKLNDDLVREIRLLHKNGISKYSLARKYGVGETTIGQVVNNITWRHVL